MVFTACGSSGGISPPWIGKNTFHIGKTNKCRRSAILPSRRTESRLGSKSMIDAILRDLRQPEYIHVLINPLPVYGLAMGLLGLIVAFFLKSRSAQIVALIIVLIRDRKSTRLNSSHRTISYAVFCLK